MTQLTKRELATTLEIISECTACESDEVFRRTAEKTGDFLQADHLVFLSSRTSFLGAVALPQVFNVSYPTEWMDIYLARGYREIDPVLTSGLKGLCYWKDLFKAVPPDQEFYSQAVSFGLAEGCSYAATTHNSFTLFSAGGKGVEDSRRSREIVHYLVPHLQQKALSLAYDLPLSNLPKLTPREREVLLWAMDGKSNWEISVVLGIGQESVKEHISNLLRKLNASNRTHAVAIALQNNLLGTLSKETFC